MQYFMEQFILTLWPEIVRAIVLAPFVLNVLSPFTQDLLRRVSKTGMQFLLTPLL